MADEFHKLPDYFDHGSDAERAAARHAIKTPAAASNGHDNGSSDETPKAWPTPKPLPDGLLRVKSFELDYLPESIGPWVGDIADRMQCPPDFVGVAAIVALGAALGRKVAIRPQRETDWEEVPNLWGCVVGRPGAMKSPAMQEALKPLHRLESDARKDSDEARRAYDAALVLHKIEKEVAAGKAREAFKKGTSADGLLDLNEPEEPKAKRFVTNDTSYEKLGEILADNPDGVLAYRDELVSLLRTLDREEQAGARGFYLTAWSGTAGYTFDRITRRKTHIEGACVSLLGSTQPGRLADYIGRAVAGGAGDDGLIQRFGLITWPDQSPEWRETDRAPSSSARERAWETFVSCVSYDPTRFGASRDGLDGLPYHRFDDSALDIFRGWRSDLEKRLREGELSPSLESHLSKYRKTVPALALINHVADSGAGTVGEAAVLRALAFADYLESHARRAYAAGNQNETVAAKAILSRIRKGQLESGFMARDIRRKEWSNLTDNGAIKAGLDLLSDFDWIVPQTVQTLGRSRTSYAINPRVFA